MTGSLAPGIVQPLLEGRFGDPYLYERETESTQLLLSDPTLPEGAVAATDHQTAGRGRLGRRWDEPTGTSVLCSVLLRPPVGRNPPELSLVAALAAAETVDDAVVGRGEVKWPNDVLLEGRKVAGILAEMRSDRVVLGIGLNVNQTEEQLDRAARVPPGSLRTATGRTHDRAQLLARLLARLEGRYDTWVSSGLELLFPELRGRDFLRGRRVRVDGEGGTAVGIGPSGELEVDFEGGRRLVGSGEVLLAHDLG